MKNKKSREQIERQIEHSKKYIKYISTKKCFNDAVASLKRTKSYLCDLYNSRYNDWSFKQDVEYYSIILSYFKKIIKNTSLELKKLKYELKKLS